MNVVDVLLVAWVALPALLWGSVAERSWHFLRSRKPRSALFHILPSMSACAALAYGAVAALTLLHGESAASPSVAARFLSALAGSGAVASMAQLLHLVRVVPFRGEVPSRLWLLVNYGVALVVMAFWIAGHAGSAEFGGELGLRVMIVPLQAYEVAWILAAFYYTVQLARPGGWRPRGFLDVRSPDALVPIFVIVVGVAAVMMSGSSARTPLWHHSPLLDWTRGAIGLALAAPFAIRMLGEVVPRFLVAGVLLAMTSALIVGARAAHAFVRPAVAPLVDMATVLALLLVLAPGRSWLSQKVDRIVLRRQRRHGALLHAALDEVPVDLGTVGCCRRGLEAVVRITQCRGASILLPREDLAIVEGDFDVQGLRQAWPSGKDATVLFRRGIGQLEFADLSGPLQEALVAADVVALWPIRSPRRDWGHLAMTAGLLGMVVSDRDASALNAFTSQLGRVLDGAELLERAVAVERSLAHAEKLAAIGELTARVVHEIRNPVAAARSLAQQLASEPGAPFAEEHAVILTELDRVEREVRSLLRFARREEPTLSDIDLRELVDGTVGDLGARFEAAKIAVSVHGDTGVAVSADREKMRQVFVNLLENACDAMADASDPKRITVEVWSRNGNAGVRFSDSGPGVEPELLNRLFEPFFTKKANGTGLGLAIVKRTVEAHGGHIEATAAPGHGLSICIDLPLAAAHRGEKLQ